MTSNPVLGKDKFIFISYSHKDTRRVMPVVNTLRKSGYYAWCDDRVKAGSDWDQYIAEHIDGCSLFIAFISKNYMDSDNCKDELNYARDLDGKLLLIYLERDAVLPSGMAMRLNRIQAINKYDIGSDTEFYAKLYEAENIDLCRTAEKGPQENEDGAKARSRKKAPDKVHKETKKHSFILLIIATVLECAVLAMSETVPIIIVMLFSVLLCIIGKSGLGYKGHRIWSQVLFWIGLISGTMGFENFTNAINYVPLELAILVVGILAYYRPKWLTNLFKPGSPGGRGTA